MENNEIKIPKRILSSLLSSLAAGVVPRSGAPYIAIGREEEVGAVLDDLSVVSDGGAGMRFIIGKYGSGKSFLLQLIRGYAIERDFVTADTDLSPERRFSGSKGTGRATFCDLIRNLACKSSPDGAALLPVITRWLSGLQSEAAAEGFEPGSDGFNKHVEKRLFEVVRSLETQVGGFDFALVLSRFYRAYLCGDDQMMSCCLRWLRGEFTTKTEARSALGVSSIIDDDNWYDYIKLYAVFFRRAGYRGFVVMIDECVNLYKIPNRISRENNYEKILSMFNDALQSKAEGLELLLGGTPQFLEDGRRGLYSYEALKSRLYDSRFSDSGYKNLIGPVIRLRRLSDGELYALIVRLTRLHSQYHGINERITDEEQQEFLKLCLARAGADTMITPREIIRDYVSLLNILMQNPDSDASSLIKGGAVKLDHPDRGDDDPLPQSGYDSKNYDFKSEDIVI
ncbi:MAG: ATP-binding protein [Clostridia bacterium]|nr:ATP-binding protein [Clostridia bacterium]